MSIHDRGFASMSRERQLEIAKKGGRRAHELGVAHKWTTEEARAAGLKGAAKTRGRRKIRRPVTAPVTVPVTVTDIGTTSVRTGGDV